MFDFLNQNLRFFYRFALTSVCLVSAVQHIFAQEQNHHSGRQIIVGELTGRIDLRNFEIFTKQGYFEILGKGDNWPFRVTHSPPGNLIVDFFDSPDLKVFNPKIISFKFYENERALISAIILEEVDVAVLDNLHSAQDVIDSNGIFETPPIWVRENKVKIICYNHRNPILKSSKVRAALAYAIDHKNLIEKIKLTQATIARGPFDNDSPLYNSGMETYEHNPKRAILLLKEEGWRDTNGDGILDKNNVPLELELYYQKGLRTDEAISRQIKINLLKIGIHIKPKPLRLDKINDQLSAKAFDAVLMDYTFEENIESLEEFFSLDGTQNFMGYKSQSLEINIGFYHKNENPQTKKTIIKSIQKIINRDQPVNFLYFGWYSYYMINRLKLHHFRDLKDGDILPFEDWILLDFQKK